MNDFMRSQLDGITQSLQMNPTGFELHLLT